MPPEVETDPVRDAHDIRESVQHVIDAAVAGEWLAKRCLEEMRESIARFVIESGR